MSSPLDVFPSELSWPEAKPRSFRTRVGDAASSLDAFPSAEAPEHAGAPSPPMPHSVPVSHGGIGVAAATAALTAAGVILLNWLWNLAHAVR